MTANVTVCVEGAQQDQELSDEAVQHRQTDRGKRDDHEDRRKDGQGSGQPSKFIDESRMPAVINHSD